MRKTFALLSFVTIVSGCSSNDAPTPQNGPPPNYSAQVSGPASVVAGACNAYTIGVLDAGGTAVAAPSDFNFSVSGVAPTLYSDAGCTTAITSATVTTGQTSGTAYAKFTQAGASGITFTPPAANVTISVYDVTVTAAAGSVVTVAAPSSQIAGACGEWHYSIKDKFGNDASLASAGALSLASAAGFQAYAASDCSGSATTSISVTSSGTFGLVTNVGGTFTATPTVLGAALANVSTSILPASANKLALIGPTQVKYATCAHFTVYVEDTYNNNSTTATPVTLVQSGDPSDNTLYSDDTCTTAIVGPVSVTGLSQFYAKAGSTTQKNTINATSTGLASAMFDYQVAPHFLTSFTFVPSTAVLSGPLLVTITLKDEEGNAFVPYANIVVSLTFSGAFTMPNGSVTIPMGWANTPLVGPTVTGTKDQVGTVTATIPGFPPQSGDVTITGTVICTELHRQGLLPDAIWTADAKFGAERIPAKTVARYNAWGAPLAKLMARSSLVTAVVRPFATAWAYEMAYQMGAYPESNLLGRTMLGYGIPVSDVVGGTIQKIESAIH